MNNNIESALNVLYQRQISSREQLLIEMLRVKMTLKKIGENTDIISDKEKVFQIMKKTTEDELGFFPADRADFIEIYKALKDIDLIEYVLYIYKDDRMGMILSPEYLVRYIYDRIKEIKPKKILITEAEKHLAGLWDLINDLKDSYITITTQYKPMYLLLKLAFENLDNIIIKFESIYSNCLEGEKFDYIYCLPTFGYKYEEFNKGFLTKDSDGIAVENMLSHLDHNGTLDIIVPAKITFTSMGYEKLRSFITSNYNVESIYILPEGTFRPSTSIKTYMFSITTNIKPSIQIGIFEMENRIISVNDKKIISREVFLSNKDWRIEILMADDDENIQKFKSSRLHKVKIKDVAEVFRGKSILKKDTSLGEIFVLNISNIEDGQIDYENMDTIDEEERKIKRYELITGDVVLSCRGTAIKTAVFQAQKKTIIASANLIVVRPNENIRGEFIKIFFESPVGLAIIKSFQRGTTVMNINHADIMEVEIPLLSIDKQEKLIAQYNEEFNQYKEIIKEAETRWDNIKTNIYNELI